MEYRAPKICVEEKYSLILDFYQFKQTKSMIKLFMPILLLGMFTATAQTLDPEGIFSSAGNHKVDGYAQISWTLGDNQTRTYKSSEIVLTQGFLQSRINITNVPELSTKTQYKFILYPNPVSDVLFIQKDNKLSESIGMELYSQDGKLILKKSSANEKETEQINFSGLENGIYLLVLFSEQKAFKNVYRIAYQN